MDKMKELKLGIEIKKEEVITLKGDFFSAF